MAFGIGCASRVSFDACLGYLVTFLGFARIILTVYHTDSHSDGMILAMKSISESLSYITLV